MRAMRRFWPAGDWGDRARIGVSRGKTVYARSLRDRYDPRYHVIARWEHSFAARGQCIRVRHERAVSFADYLHRLANATKHESRRDLRGIVLLGQRRDAGEVP